MVEAEKAALCSTPFAERLMACAAEFERLQLENTELREINSRLTAVENERKQEIEELRAANGYVYILYVTFKMHQNASKYVKMCQNKMHQNASKYIKMHQMS